MKVNAYKTVDVECEVDVNVEDCINEMLDMAKDDGMRWRKMSAVDGATKVLEKITPDMVAEILAKNPNAIEVIRKRIQKWMGAE